MKKNRMMRCASGLLVAVLLTTSMIAGTFAKYTTQDSGSDMARVAKWGVELQVAGDLYSDGYIKTTNTAKTSDNDSISVQADAAAGDTADNVVAPGTKNTENGLSFTLNGKPEVSTEVTTKVIAQNIWLNAGSYGVMVKVPEGKVTAANYAELKDSLYTLDNTTYSKAEESFDEEKTYYTLEDDVEVNNTYYPVVYGLNSSVGEEKLEGSIDNDSLKLAVEEILNRATSAEENSKVSMTADTAGVLYTHEETKEYAPNQDLANLKLSKTSLTWEWKFCQEDIECSDGNEACEHCEADTILGYMIAECKADKETSAVVYKAKDSTAESYTAVTYTNVKEAADTEEYKYAAYDYAKAGEDGDTIACLTTQFSIDITVTQVD